MQYPSGKPCSRSRRATESLPTPDGPESTNTRPLSGRTPPGSAAMTALPVAAGVLVEAHGDEPVHRGLAIQSRGATMPFDALTLHSVRDEIEHRLLDAFVERVVQSGDSEFGLQLYCRPGTGYLLVSAE